MPTAPSLTWSDLLEALDVAETCFARWRDAGALTGPQMAAIASFYAGWRETWAKASAAGSAPPADLGLPPRRAQESAMARALRHWAFVDAEILRHHAANRLGLAQVHQFRGEVRERTAALRRRLEVEEAREGRPQASAAAPSGPRPEGVRLGTGERDVSAMPRRPLIEILLDPKSILWLLALGGALMVTGLVILLWVNDWFTPPVIAWTLGLGNAGLLLLGWAVMRYSRYQFAGRALTLLACLIMPLNLWFYHTHDLLTIEGHLWVAAVAISVLYALSAWALRDELFVYVFAAGVTLTGLLIQANQHRFWEVAAPSTLLVALGLLAIHVERAFPEREGPFSRGRFGMAFFRSGHVLLAAGLLLLLGAQIASNWLYEPFFRGYYEAHGWGRTPLVLDDWGRWLALGLVAAGTYAYVYSELVVRKVGVYVYAAALTLMWSEVLTLEALHVLAGTEVWIAVLAGTALVVNLLHASDTARGRLGLSFSVLGLSLGVLALSLGVITYLRALNPDLRGVWESEQPPTWGFVAAMLLTAAAFRAGAVVTRTARRPLSVVNFFGAAAAVLVAAVAALAVLGLKEWQQHAPWLMLVPFGYLVAARVTRGRPEEAPFAWVAHAAALVMLASSVASALKGFTHIVEREHLNLVLAIFFAEAAAFYALASAWRPYPATVHLCAAAACAAVWQVLTYFGVQAEVYTLTFALVGLGLLVAYRFATPDRFAGGGLAETAFQSGNTILSLALLAGVFMGVARVASQQMHPERDVLTVPFVTLSLALVGVTLIAIGLIRAADWRRWYVVMTACQALVILFALQLLSHLSVYQKLEIFSVIVGLGLLAVGHVGWYREQDRHSDLVSVSLFLGSVLAGLPLAIATVLDRSRGSADPMHDHMILLNEMGFLAVSVLLLASGFVLQLKSTTLIGAALTALYFVSLLVYVPWSRLNTVAVMITAGGAVIFGTGLILSLYRDRLLTLPERVQKREGVFRVLSWR